MSRQEWFPLPEMYRTFQREATKKRFAAAYIERTFPKWKPIQLDEAKNRVLAIRREEKRGEADGHLS